MRTRLLPWDYGVRNLFRRLTRSGITLASLATVIFLILVIVGFIRGLESSLSVSGDSQVALVYALSSGADIENSSIAARTPSLLAASVEGVQRRYGAAVISPELFVGTRIQVGQSETVGLGLVRGVTPMAPQVRRSVQMVEGAWPGPGEVLVGRLAHAKLGCSSDALGIGETIDFDGNSWNVSGIFSAGGAAFESEVWCPLQDMQAAMKRQDISLAALLMAPGGSISDVELFCKERIDLELKAIGEAEYYASLTKHYRPVLALAWCVAGLVAGAGVFSGLNTMYGAVVGRTRELATLQALGYRRRAILLTLIQEATLLSAMASVLACIFALAFVNDAAVRFTMGAFSLRVDSVGILIGCAIGLALGVIGALPPAFKAMRLSIVDAIKAI